MGIWEVRKVNCLTTPAGFDPIDTSFTKRQVVANNPNNPAEGDEGFFSLGYVAEQEQYAFAIFALGLENPLFGFFLSQVVSIDFLDAFVDPDPESLLFVLFMERLIAESNSPSAPTRVVFEKAQKIHRQTLRPVGNSVALVPPKRGRSFRNGCLL